MSKRVILQAGHYPNDGGAPGEANWTKRLCDAMAARLQARGVETVVVGGYFNNQAAIPAVVGESFALCACMHYDADIYPVRTGCFADRYRPELFAASDPRRAHPNPNAAEEDRFVALWESLYPAATAIPLHNERRNGNTRDYYLYRYTSADTSTVLIEHGVGMGDDHALLYDHLDLVAATDALAITQFLGLEDDDDVALRDELEATKAELANQQGINTTLGEQLAEKDRLLRAANSRVGALEHDVLEPLQAQVESLRRQVDLAGHRSAREVVVVLDDGTSQRFAPAPPNGGNGNGG